MLCELLSLGVHSWNFLGGHSAELGQKTGTLCSFCWFTCSTSKVGCVSPASFSYVLLPCKKSTIVREGLWENAEVTANTCGGLAAAEPRS